MRRRRLHVYGADPKRAQGDMFDRELTGFHPDRARHGGVVNIADIKNLFFSAPRRRPIDLFGPLANRTILQTTA